MIRWIVLALALFLFATPALAQDRTRVDRYRLDGQRDGYVIVDERTGQIDLYDTHAKRTGYGRITPDGRVDLYGPKSERLGRTTPKPRGRP